MEKRQIRLLLYASFDSDDKKGIMKPMDKGKGMGKDGPLPPPPLKFGEDKGDEDKGKGMDLAAPPKLGEDKNKMGMDLDEGKMDLAPPKPPEPPEPPTMKMDGGYRKRSFRKRSSRKRMRSYRNQDLVFLLRSQS